MTEHTKTSELPPEELKNLLQRATEGDTSVLPQVQELFEAAPAVAAKVGNLGKQVEQALVDQIARNDLLMKEVLSFHLRQMYEGLAGPSPSYLEQMLVQEIVVCWLQTRQEDLLATRHPQNDTDQKRQDRAHKRFLNAVRELARIRKLLIPTQIQLNVGRQVNAMQMETPIIRRDT